MPTRGSANLRRPFPKGTHLMNSFLFNGQCHEILFIFIWAIYAPEVELSASQRLAGRRNRKVYIWLIHEKNLGRLFNCPHRFV